MHSEKDPLQNHREARKQRLLAKAQQRLLAIESGGSQPSSQQPTAPESLSKVLPDEVVKLEHLQADRSPIISLAGSSSADQGFLSDEPGTVPNEKAARPALQPAHSAALQPVSSPLPATFSGSGSDSDSDNRPLVTTIPPPTAAAGRPRYIEHVLSTSKQSPDGVHGKRNVGSNGSGCVREPAPAVSVSAAALHKSHECLEGSQQPSHGSPHLLTSFPRGTQHGFCPDVPEAADSSKASGWMSRIERAAAGTAGVRSLTSATVAVMTIASSHYDRQVMVAGDPPAAITETSRLWSAMNSELWRVPPLLLLLATNLALIAASCTFWSGQQSHAAASHSGRLDVKPGLVQRLLRTAAPRLYAFAAAFMSLVGVLWQDVAVLAFVGALVTFILGPHFEQHREGASPLSFRPLRQAARL